MSTNTFDFHGTLPHLNELVEKHKITLELIKRTDTINLVGSYSNEAKHFIGFKIEQSNDYTFETVREIIGYEKMNFLIEKVALLIKLELEKADRETIQELCKYSIVKKY